MKLTVCTKEGIFPITVLLMQPTKDLAYELKVYDDLGQMVTAIKEQEKVHTLSRMVAGYAWKWLSKKNSTVPDIVIGDTKLFWNSKIHDWVNSPNAINEVGCIHTIQGYDLNYTGVIIGQEMSYDPIKKVIVVDKSKYLDSNGHKGVSDPEELRRYIINIYKTLLTRGILGTYVYVVDENLRQYFKEVLSGEKSAVKPVDDVVIETPSPYQEEMIELPLYDSVGCGELMYADPTVHETYPVLASLVKP